MSPREQVSVLLTALLLALGLCSPASASTSQVTFLDATDQLNGENSRGEVDHTLNELQALGVDVLRYQVYWIYVAPDSNAASPPAGFDPRNPNTYGPHGANWAPIDAVTRGATARGMSVDLMLSGRAPTGVVPRWASRDPSGSRSDPDPKAFEDFAYAVGKRYNGGPSSVSYAHYVSVWNEPNSSYYLRAGRHHPGGVPALYRRLVAAAGTGLAEAGWTGKLLAGELGPTRPGGRGDPLPFMRRVLCLDAKNRPVGGGCPRLDIDGWAHHPYSFRRAPFLTPYFRGQISFGNLGQMQRLLNRAGKVGALPARTPIYATEYGYPTRPDSALGISRQQQADFDSIAEYLAYRNPGVASFAQYLLIDPPQGRRIGFTSGLCPSGAPERVYGGRARGCKPAYAAFRTPLVIRDLARCPTHSTLLCGKTSRRVMIWGHIRPVNRPAPVTILVKDRGGRVRPLRTVQTNAAGYFQFPSSNRPGRRWAVSWSHLRGPLTRAYSF